MLKVLIFDEFQWISTRAILFRELLGVLIVIAWMTNYLGAHYLRTKWVTYSVSNIFYTMRVSKLLGQMKTRSFTRQFSTCSSWPAFSGLLSQLFSGLSVSLKHIQTSANVMKCFLVYLVDYSLYLTFSMYFHFFDWFCLFRLLLFLMHVLLVGVS